MNDGSITWFRFTCSGVSSPPHGRARTWRHDGRPADIRHVVFCVHEFVLSKQQFVLVQKI